jgi:tripartite-type tricarboxylate transporter receptor subunit TctC
MAPGLPVRHALANVANRVLLIEPFGAGGGPDVVARALAGPLSEHWHRPVEVANHPGGGSTVGPALVAKAPADGNTLLVNTCAHAYSAAVARDLPYDPLGDFAAVTPLTRQAYVVIAGPSTGASTVSELVAAAKARPDALRFGSTGVGTGTHVGTVELNIAAGIRAMHVPAGPDDAISDVVANVARGALDYAMAPVSVAARHITSGAVAAIGVTTARRSLALPDVPAIAEAGVAGYDFPIWYGVWAPSATPIDILDDRADGIASVLREPEVQDWLVNQGMDTMRMTREAFARFVVDESQRAARSAAALL